MASAVIRSRENGEQAATSESFETIHDTFVSPKNKVYLVVFEEGLDTIWSELDNISGTIWITNEVRLDTKFTVSICWVTPKDVNYKLLLDRRHLMNDFKRSLDLFNLLQAD